MKYSKIYNRIRSVYQAKRRTKKWKKRKYNAKLQRARKIQSIQRYQQKPYEDFEAPKKFNFIDNTDEVLEYLERCNYAFKKKSKVNFNIQEIEELTPDAINLLVASINDPKFTFNGSYIGNAPKDKKLNKLFTASGFYNFVSSSSLVKQNLDLKNNLLHKETDYKVRPLIAKGICIKGLEHVTNSNHPFEPLYEILIEAMQNTNNHASADKGDKTKWWTYVYNDPETGNSIYTFLDLGVGIFDSIVVKTYLQKQAQKIGLHHNVNYVKDLLDGKIQSRIEEDNEIRGKGIPQIVNNAQLDCFKRFYIVSNNVKIDVKNKIGIKLNNNFSGTFLYWELQKGNCYGNQR